MEEAVAYLRAILHRALSEDVGHADITTDAMPVHPGRTEATVVHRAGGVLAGVFCIGETLTATSRFLGLDEDFQVRELQQEGISLPAGAVICRIEADASLMLAAERIMLNFLGRLCGIADLTARFVEAVKGTNAKILDTRKTTPLLRSLEKYAVRAGGGVSHRFGLYDQILIKDNHLRIARASMAQLIASARDYLKKHGIRAPVEIEIESLQALKPAIDAGADIVMLDNMPLEDLRRAVSIRDHAASGILLEVSGGVTLETVRGIAETGVDRISVGALTHSAPAADVALDFSE